MEPFNLHEWKEDEIDFAENCWGYSLAESEFTKGSNADKMSPSPLSKIGEKRKDEMLLPRQ